jgi:hypothetical protein
MPTPLIVPPTGYSNSPQPSLYGYFPSPFPNIDFPMPYWINKLKDFALIGCTNPDLAYAELFVVAAARAMFTAFTPSTKQIVEMATGRSWICNAKSIVKEAEVGEEIAESGAGRFVYGLAAGVDIAAYHAFWVSLGATAVSDFVSFAAAFQRRCNGSQSPYRGVTPIGGWPTSISGPTPHGSPPVYLTATGEHLGMNFTVKQGEVGVCVAWCNFTSLYYTGGVIAQLRLFDGDTNETLDEDIVDNWKDLSKFAIVRYFTTEGLAPVDRHIHAEVNFLTTASNRTVCGEGGCYVRSFKPGLGDAPPFWNMKTDLKTREAA